MTPHPETRMTNPPRPTIDRRKLSHIAATLAGAYAELGWQWVDPADAVADTRRYTPNAIDIALAIVDRAQQLQPGGSLSSGRLIVAWEYEAGYPENQELTVQLDLGSFSTEARP